VTPYIAAYLAVLIWCMYRMRDDERALWAGVVILGQALAIYLVNRMGDYNPLMNAVVYAVAAFTFLVFSVRKTGVALGVTSAACGLVMCFGYWGLISAQTGLGITGATVWNFASILSYGQLIILWSMGDDRGHIERWRFH